MSRLRFGSDSEGLYELTEFRSGQIPFEIGSLEREALSYLGEWSRCQREGDPFGFYYRMGIKEGVKDAEGDPATVFLHFAAPFTKEGHTMTPQIEAIIDQALARLIHLSTVAFSLSVDNAIGVRALPPEYMLKELIQNNSEVTTEARPR